jgi:2-oxo-4-hydroxy-4-carboxy-5-ureidoimidazoline decarboxylase
MKAPVTLRELNDRDQAGFVAVCGPLFESSPWIAARAWLKRPYGSIDALYRELTAVVEAATAREKLALISAHPDLVGRLARRERLSAESRGEQAAAGLEAVSEAERERFDRLNREYREKFGFPFVICARENRKEAILAAFPARLAHTREQEIAAALAEIAKIARLRLADAVTED